jgi:hypothetical protein
MIEEVFTAVPLTVLLLHGVSSDDVQRQVWLSGLACVCFTVPFAVYPIAGIMLILLTIELFDLLVIPIYKHKSLKLIQQL